MPEGDSLGSKVVLWQFLCPVRKRAMLVQSSPAAPGDCPVESAAFPYAEGPLAQDGVGTVCKGQRILNIRYFLLKKKNVCE